MDFCNIFGGTFLCSFSLNFQNQTGKVGHLEKKYVIVLKPRKEPNMFDFGAFEEKMHMLSRENQRAIFYDYEFICTGYMP